jgi:hypothetical protein
MDRSWTVPVIVISLIVILTCCACLLSLAAGWLVYSTAPFRPGQPGDVNAQAATATATPAAAGPDEKIRPLPVFTPTPPPLEPSPAASQPEASPPPTPAPAGDTIAAIENALVPASDLIDLARRLQGMPGIPPTLAAPAAPFQVGDRKTFWAGNVDTNENFQVEATLRYRGERLYFWVENGVRYSPDDLERLGETFDQQIYSTNREFFGSEWTPGVDSDPRLYVLYARDLGSSVAGYYSSADQYPPQAHEYSNAHEMFFLSADNIELDEEFTYGVLAHEFQHMIHWYQDRNEETWVGEGFSELAAFLNGYTLGGFDLVYAADTDLQLTNWPAEGDTAANYGAAFLFMAYFLDRFGEQATQALVRHPENGLVSVDRTLADLGAVDLLSGQPIRADDLFIDWAVANYVQDGRVQDGRYQYSNYAAAPQVAATGRVRACPAAPQPAEVHQYGVDYIRITCRGSYRLRFEGAPRVSLLPADPYSGRYAFWSNRGDESDMTLTRTFDFSEQSGPLTLRYQTWYNLETDFDFVYVLASTDGERWEILRAPSSTDADATGNSYGWGYTGSSLGWIEEEVDLSAYAGQQVQVRFEYVTDSAVNQDGLLLDDIAIPEIGYSTDFESGDGGWQAAGFVRIQNDLPQTFRLALITRKGAIQVQTYTLSGDNQLEVPLQLGWGQEAILVVGGTARITRQPAAYTFSLLSGE